MIDVANVLLNWYMLFRRIAPGKTSADISNLRSLSHKYIGILCIIAIIFVFFFSVIVVIIVIILSVHWIFSEQRFLTVISWAG